MLDQYEGKRKIRRGLLGDSNDTVAVANRPGWAYIRYHDNLNELAIVRYLIPEQLVDGTPVVVGKKHPEDPFEQVLGVDWTMYAWSPAASSVSAHATQVITLNDLAPGKVVPTDPVSLSVDVRAFLYVDSDTAVEFGGSTLDLTASVPGGAGHRMTLVYVDLDTNILAAEDGTIVAVGTDAAAPSTPENGLPLALVDLANGETTIEGDDITQYKALYMPVGGEIELSQLGSYARGHIIRGGATDWEAHDASGDGYPIVGDGTDVASVQKPTWKGTHSWTVGDDEAIIINLDAAQSVDGFQIKNSGGSVVSGFDERGVLYSHANTSVHNVFAGNDAGNSAMSGIANIAIGTETEKNLTTGQQNIAIGYQALLTNVNGGNNVVVGTRAGYNIDGASGDDNTLFGHYAGYTLATHTDNTMIGSASGLSASGDRNIYLGANSGKNQAGVDDTLLIDNQTRANAAAELTHSILYGTMAANPESQQLTINVDSLTVGTDADSDVVMNWVANSNSGTLTWMEDEDHFLFGDTVNMNHVGLQNIYQQTVTVAKAGGDFTTIQGAIDYAVTQVPSTTNRFCVLIHPGDYAETITGADYVELMGLSAREAANITGATGPLYTFPDNEGHIFNLKFTLSPTTDAQTIIDVPATVVARQAISNCLFTVTSASDVATYVFDIKAGEIECINNRVIFTNTNTAGGVIRSQRIWNVSGNAIVDLYGNIVDVDIYDINDRVYIYTDASLAGGEIHIKENVIRVNSRNAGAYSGVVVFILYTGATATLHAAHNFVELTSAEVAGTGAGTFVRSNSAGSGLIRATANHVIVQGFATNYWASVAAGDTIVSHFDNVVAVDGVTGAGTITYVNSQADGELGVSGIAHFQEDVLIEVDSKALQLGGGQDMDIGYDGTDGYLRTDLVAPSDLNVDCGAQKTIELQTVVYDDFVVPVSAIRLGGGNPADEIAYKDGMVISFDDAADEYAYFVIQLPHRYKEGTDINLHLHWTPKVSGAGAGVENVKWDLTYSACSPTESWPASSAGTATVDVQNDSADDHLVDDVATLTGAGFKISEVIICSLKRDTAVANNYGDEAYVVSIDVHYQVNTLGSRQEWVK
jgi:hypothetical protein